MRSLRFVGLLVFGMLAAVAAEVSAQDHQPEPTTRHQFNQVFVKLIMPGTSGNPEQNDPVVESWIAGELKKLGETEYFAVTDWVPVCDALLEDDVVDNHVWGGGRLNQIQYCPVCGDIPDRKNGRLLVNVSGWLPLSGCEANINLADEPGNRAISPLQIGVGEGQKPMKIEESLPYVVVIIAPPERRWTAKLAPRINRRQASKRWTPNIKNRRCRLRRKSWKRWLFLFGNEHPRSKPLR